MKISLLDITVRDLVAGCHDDGDGGVVGYWIEGGNQTKKTVKCSAAGATERSHQHNENRLGFEPTRAIL